MAMKKLLLAGIAALLMATSAAHAAEPSFEAVSQCFFIDGAVFEAAKKTMHNELFQFAKSRLSWVAGYMQANTSNGAFVKAFEDNLMTNKRYAWELDKLLTKAIQTKDQSSYLTVTALILACDYQIGIKTQDIPKL